MSGGEQLPLAGCEGELRVAPEFHWPAWFRRRKNTPRTYLDRVGRGRHPLGARLGPEASSCGACKSRRIGHNNSNRRYWKCDLARPWTSGLATDLTLRWRGCELFEAGEPPGGGLI